MSEWQHIRTAPKDASEIEVRMGDGTVHPRCHWACDLTGEYQPAFRGWFIPDGTGKRFVQIETPARWRPIVADAAPAANSA